MNPKHPEKSHVACNQLSHNIRPDGSCKFCDTMNSEFDQPIWAVVTADEMKIYNLRYEQADRYVKDSSGDPDYHSLCIVTNEAAFRMTPKRRVVFGEG